MVSQNKENRMLIIDIEIAKRTSSDKWFSYGYGQAGSIKTDNQCNKILARHFKILEIMCLMSLVWTTVQTIYLSCNRSQLAVKAYYDRWQLIK